MTKKQEETAKKGEEMEGLANRSSTFRSIKDQTLRQKKDQALRQKAGPRRALRVLVVDDEEPIRRFVDRVLSDAGYETVVAADGASAMELAGKRQGGFDILVTDLMMPEMTGDELARRLRQRERDLKVLYLTGYSDQLFKEKVTLWQGEAFLEKPCSVKGLREAVAMLFFGLLEAPPIG